MSDSSFTRFKEQISVNKIVTALPFTAEWVYRDYGNRELVPLVCLPPLSGNHDVYYKQMLCLCPKGYRLISVRAPAFGTAQVNIPPLFTINDFVISFELFLDSLSLEHVHLMGSALGGFLALAFVELRPQRVRSLVLSNAFLSTKVFHQNAPCFEMFRYTPGFMLKRMVLQNYPNPEGLYHPAVADSIDFMVQQLESMEQQRIASRLTLNCADKTVEKVRVAPEAITIIDTFEPTATPAELQQALLDTVSGCRVAHLRLGGNFPYLANAEEFNLHVEVHLRTVGGQQPIARPAASEDAAGLIDDTDYDSLFDRMAAEDPQKAAHFRTALATAVPAAPAASSSSSSSSAADGD